MWYVVQVRTGTEENLCLLCRSRISDDILKHSFIPYYEEKKKLRGVWTILKKRLFPGYVFMVTDDVEKLWVQLAGIPAFTRLLGTDGEIIPLAEDEIRFLKRFGGEEHLVPVSEGIITGGRVRVTEGPLMGMEGQIRRVDRHKRKAWVEVKMFGGPQLVEIGLEIVAREPDEQKDNIQHAK